MPAPGTVWASGTWDTGAWATDTWADAGGGGPDVTAPTLSSLLGVPGGQTVATGYFTTDEAGGSAYWVVTTSATTPTRAQIRAGQDHLGAAAVDAGNLTPVLGVNAFGVTGLTAATVYYVHVQQDDAAANESTPASSGSFTTYSASSGQGYPMPMAGPGPGMGVLPPNAGGRGRRRGDKK